jgi:2-iminobutanoate/2-iminopropanoate deaminase
MSKKIISTKLAPETIGPYSQAISTGNFVFTAGQIPINPETGKVESSDFEVQVRRVLDNISEILKSSGTDLNSIVKLTVFVSDLNNFFALNKIFYEYFPESQPARSVIQVSRLPMDAKIEIEAIALLKE